MKSSKSRFIVLPALVLALQPITLPGAAGSGRVPPRCVQACQQIHVACDDRCSAICLSTYPESEEKYVTCLLSGKTQCDQLARECRQVCVSYKESPKLEP